MVIESTACAVFMMLVLSTLISIVTSTLSQHLRFKHFVPGTAQTDTSAITAPHSTAVLWYLISSAMSQRIHGLS